VTGVQTCALPISNIAISDIQHEAGRTDIYTQPAPSYMQVTLVALSGQTLPFEINDSFNLQVKNSSGTYVNLFGGDITDLTVEVGAFGGVAKVTNYTILAMGSLVKLARELYSDAVPQDEDGNQIYGILSSVLLGSWNDVPAAETWAGYDPTETWAQAVNLGLGEIDQPGHNRRADIYFTAFGFDCAVDPCRRFRYDRRIGWVFLRTRPGNTYYNINYDN